MATSYRVRLRHVYLALCVLGLALPYWQFVPWFLEHGLDLSLFVHELFANRIAGFFGIDVIVSSLVLWFSFLPRAAASVCEGFGFPSSRLFWSAYRSAFRFFFTSTNFTLINPRSSRSAQLSAERRRKMVTYALLLLVAIVAGAVNAMADGGGLLNPPFS